MRKLRTDWTGSHSHGVRGWRHMDHLRVRMLRHGLRHRHDHGHMWRWLPVLHHLLRWRNSSGRHGGAVLAAVRSLLPMTLLLTAAELAEEENGDGGEDDDDRDEPARHVPVLRVVAAAVVRAEV